MLSFELDLSIVENFLFSTVEDFVKDLFFELINNTFCFKILGITVEYLFFGLLVFVDICILLIL